MSKAGEKLRVIWLEEYEYCGCSSVTWRKKDLLGYCAKHGGDWSHRYKLYVTKEEADKLTKAEDE